MSLEYLLEVSDCKPGREAQYNAYDDPCHLPNIFAHAPEAISAQRFALTPHLSPDGIPHWRFSTRYAVEMDDMGASLQRSTELMKSGKISPSAAAGPGTAAVFRYVPLGPPLTRNEEQK